MTKPNIIFLMTDQQRWDCLGILNSQIKTPNLDSLAKKGIVFNQATCQCPMCIPSRNSMMFGLYPSQIGVRTNAGGFFKEDMRPSKVLAEVLKDSGYQTAGFGKTHWNHQRFNKEPSTRGFEVRAIAHPQNSPLYEKGALMMGEDNPEGLKAYYEETDPFGPGEENSKGYIGCTSQVAPEDHRDGWVAKQCLNFLEKDIDPERPLFLYLSFLKPHAGFNVPKEFEELYDIEDIPDIPQPEWDQEVDTHLGESFADINKRYESDWRSTWEQLTPQERKRSTLRYWANCTWLDSYFGQVLDKLEEEGRLQNSLIIFTSDHGEMLGERNYRFSKYCLYDSSVRVPLILSGSNIPEDKQGTIDERPAELIDLVPTISKVAGNPINTILPGLSLLSDDTRLGSFCELHGGGGEVRQAAPAYMWRKKDWKLILYIPTDINEAIKKVDEAKGELYHLQKDPHEWNNLYSEDQYSVIREKMKTELLMHLASVWARGPFYFDNAGYSKLGQNQT